MKIIVLALLIEHYMMTATNRKCRSKYFVGQSVFLSVKVIKLITFTTLMSIVVNVGGDGLCSRDEDVRHIR